MLNAIHGPTFFLPTNYSLTWASPDLRDQVTQVLNRQEQISKTNLPERSAVSAVVPDERL
jgi:hypothetical protein